ncbi:MAG: hypothetical protein AAF386_10360, partial [Pseudomonadota bacterium]
MRYFMIVLACISGPAAAETVTHAFSWKGANGYKVRGAFSYNQADVPGGLVQAQDLICFEMFGTHNTTAIGDWDLDRLTPSTPWSFY